MNGNYRKCVGITVYKDHKVLLCERRVEPADTVTEPLRYTFPPEIQKGGKWRYDGQEMQWVLFRFTGEDDEINLETEEPEFARYAWEDIDEAVKRIAEFKKNVYIEAVKKFKPVVEG